MEGEHLRPEDLELPGYKPPEVYIDTCPDDNYQPNFDFGYDLGYNYQGYQGYNAGGYDYGANNFGVPDYMYNAPVDTNPVETYVPVEIDQDARDVMNTLVDAVELMEGRGFPNVTIDMLNLESNTTKSYKAERTKDRKITRMLRKARCSGKKSSTPVSEWTSLVRMEKRGRQNAILEFREEGNTRKCVCPEGFRSLPPSKAALACHYHCGHPDCRFITTMWSSIVRHDATIHGIIRPGLNAIRCWICSYVVIHISEYARHIAVHIHDDLPDDERAFVDSEIERCLNLGLKDYRKGHGRGKRPADTALSAPSNKIRKTTNEWRKGQLSNKVLKKYKTLAQVNNPATKKKGKYFGIVSFSENGFSNVLHEKEKSRLPAPLIPQNGTYFCDLCEFCTGTVGNMKKHYTNGHNIGLNCILYECKACNYNTTTKQTYYNHFESTKHCTQVADIETAANWLLEGKPKPNFDIKLEFIPGGKKKKKVEAQSEIDKGEQSPLTENIPELPVVENIPKKAKKLKATDIFGLPSGVPKKKKKKKVVDPVEPSTGAIQGNSVNQSGSPIRSKLTHSQRGWNTPEYVPENILQPQIPPQVPTIAPNQQAALDRPPIVQVAKKSTTQKAVTRTPGSSPPSKVAPRILSFARKSTTQGKTKRQSPVPAISPTVNQQQTGFSPTSSMNLTIDNTFGAPPSACSPKSFDESGMLLVGIPPEQTGLGPPVAQNAPHMAPNDQYLPENMHNMIENYSPPKKNCAVAKKSTTGRLLAGKPPSSSSGAAPSQPPAGAQKPTARVAKKSTTGRLLKRKKSELEENTTIIDAVPGLSFRPDGANWSSNASVYTGEASVATINIKSDPVREMSPEGIKQMVKAMPIDELWGELEQRSDIKQCPCGEIYQQPVMYHAHRTIHTDEDILICGYCGKKSADKYAVYAHIADHDK